MHNQTSIRQFAGSVDFEISDAGLIFLGFLFLGLIFLAVALIYALFSLIRALVKKRLSFWVFAGVIISFPALVFGLDLMQNVDFFFTRNDNWSVGLVVVYTLAIAVWRRHSDWKSGLRD